MSRMYNPSQDKRWLPLYNSGDETIPGFALVALRGMTLIDGQAVLSGKKPNQLDEDQQNPAFLAANGPSPIPKKRTGRATQDWPAQVLHDAPGGIVFGDTCGPKSGSWYASPLFSALSVWTDPCKAIDEDDFGTVWINPGQPQTKALIATYTAGTSAIAGDQFDFGNEAVETNNSDQVRVESGVTDSGIEFVKIQVKAGTWVVAVSGTMYSTGADRGTSLAAQIAVDGTLVNQLIVSRTQDVEEDQYGNDIHRSQENVSVNAPVVVTDDSDDEGAWHDITLENITNETIKIDFLTVKAERR